MSSDINFNPASGASGDDCCRHQRCESSPPPLKTADALQDRSQSNGIRSQFRIAQMDCPTEEALIKKKLGAMKEVHSLDFNLVQRLLTVEYALGAAPAIDAAIRQLGMTPELLGEASDRAAPKPVAGHARYWPIAVATLAALGAEIAHWRGMPEWVSAALALFAVGLGGLGAFKKGLIALKNATLNINALMTVAVCGALLIRQWPEAAMVMVLFNLAELIEAKSLDRARNAIQGLMQLAPERATVMQSNGSWADVDARGVEVGSMVRAKPGERIALDGLVIRGNSAVNQAPITGESLPVDKKEGDAVFAGTVNGSGALEFKVTAKFGNTTLSRIIHAVEEAQGARAPSQRFVDHFAKVYTPVVFAVAIAAALIPPLLLGAPWLDWIYKALVLLVIACPCALVISTPVTIVSGLAAAAKQGILIKGGVYLEEGRKLRWLALDKTGTITHGRPVQTNFEPRGSFDASTSRRIAVSLASRSDHPVSRALAMAGEQDRMSLFDVTEFTALLGRGVAGIVEGKTYRLGNHRLMEELGVCSPDLERRLESLEKEGKTTLALTDGSAVLAIFGVADTVRYTSRKAITDLHALGIKSLMLTGDNEHTATAIGEQVGIDEIRGNLLPENKSEIIAAKSASGDKIGMVGDGINDAPALARADIGFAMGAAGTDSAIETADVALMDDDLRKIPAFYRLSRATHQILVQNIALAIGIKAIVLGLTFAGRGTMWMAVFADMGASLLVVFNGLRLLRIDARSHDQ